MLLELVDYVMLGLGKFMEVVFEDIMKMLVVNLFWMLLLLLYENMGLDNFDLEEEELMMELVWLYL